MAQTKPGAAPFAYFAKGAVFEFSRRSIQTIALFLVSLSLLLPDYSCVAALV
jgi:hypothetical protein